MKEYFVLSPWHEIGGKRSKNFGLPNSVTRIRRDSARIELRESGTAFWDRARTAAEILAFRCCPVPAQRAPRRPKLGSLFSRSVVGSDARGPLSHNRPRPAAARKFASRDAAAWPAVTYLPPEMIVHQRRLAAARDVRALAPRWGHAQIDFGKALPLIAFEERKSCADHFIVADLHPNLGVPALAVS